MYPHERALVNEMKGRPFSLIGVNSDDNREEIRQLVTKEKINWRAFQNEPEGATSSISQEWAVRGWPTLVVLDAGMKIVYRGHDGDEAIDKVKELVKALEASK